jgi:fucose permease
MGGLQFVAVVAVSGALVFGMVLTLLGSIKLALTERLGLSEGGVGWLLFALNLALIPATLLSGVLIDLWSPRGVLVTGSLIAAAALTMLATMTRSKNYSGVLMAVLAAGVGAAFLGAACIVLMPQAFFAGSLTASLNLGNVFFGLGALLTPTLAWLLIGRFGFRRTVLLLTLFCLVPATAAALSLLPPFDQTHFRLVPQEDIAALPASVPASQFLPFILAAVAFFLYGPVEFAISTWCTTYLVEQGYKPQRAELILSLFWLVFLASRLAVAFLGQASPFLDSFSAGLVTVLAFLAAAILGNLAGAAAAREGRGVLGILTLAAVLGPIFPTLVGIVFDPKVTPPRLHGTAYGAVFAIGSTGSLLLAPLLGLFARRSSVRQAWRILTFLCLALGLTAFTLGMAQLASRS